MPLMSSASDSRLFLAINLPRVLVVRREARRMGRLSDFAPDDLVESVVPTAVLVGSVHEMHACDRRLRWLRMNE